MPGYRFVTELGRGGFAWVIEARTDAGAEVALKLARFPRDPRFAREAEALRRVGPPAVPALLGEGEADGRPYLVLERLHGPTLAAWLAGLPADGVPPLPTALELFTGICEAVARVHAVGVVHRDLKPENVLLRDGRIPVLLDLGLARGEATEAAVELTRTGQRLGTTHYMSPEQCAGKPADARADVYALGVILFELLTGRPPFVGDEAEVLRGHASLRPPRPSTLRPDAAPFDELILRCLEKEPERRYAGAGELRDALREAGSAKPEPGPSARTQSAPSTSQRRQVPLLGVAARAPLTEVSAAVEPEGGTLAKVRPGLYVVAFPEHASTVAGLRAAVRAASRLGQDRRVIHVAELRIRPGQVGTRLAGAALDRPAWWDEAPAGTAVWLTKEAAALLQGAFGEPGPSGHVELRDSAVSLTRDEGQVTAPLVGREELLVELAEEAQRALRLGEPGLAELVADAGLGKTRVLGALASTLSGLNGPRVALLRAGNPLSGDSGGLLSWLLPLAGLTPETVLARTRGMAPDAERHTLARLVGEGLRHCAAERPLVLLVDDAQWADAVSLDALELATVAESRAPLWVLLAGRPELRGLRPALGDRAARHLSPALPPLSPPHARQLLLELLRPLEYVPHAALERLEALARGVPLYLVELVRALRDSGAVRRAPSGEWTLAPDELLDVSAAPLFPRLGERALEPLPANMR
ncbi:MAG TPA: protein kinase, partial [Longimicrobium sp.]|nr:protein kinase [Longimicrobium sp.]